MAVKPGRKRALTRSETAFPASTVRRSVDAKTLTPERRQLICQDIKSSITAAFSARQIMSDNWKMYTEVYELMSPVINEPFPDSSNVSLPVAVAKLDALYAQVAAKVFVPDLFIVSGNTPEASADASDIQQWYNNDFRKNRDTEEPRLKTALNLLLFGLLEGTAVLAVSWRYAEEDQIYTVLGPAMDENGDIEVDDDATPKQEVYEVYKTLVVSEAQWRCLQIKDFHVIPNESPTIEKSVAVAECFWLYEADMRAMCEGDHPEMDLEIVELVLDYAPNGQSEVAADRQGHWDKSAGGQSQIGQGQGSLISSAFANRGPFKIWKYTTDQFDMNDDGRVEKNNIFWYAEISNLLPGWTPSRTIARQRGYFSFNPMPRKNSFYGYGFMERMIPINNEIDTIHNTRNNRASIVMNPPIFGNMQYEEHSKKYTWGMGKIWWVDDVDKAFKIMEVGDVPVSGYQEEAQLNSYADQLAGMSAPMVGGQTSGKKSATEIKASIAGSGTRSDMIALLLRYTLRDAFQYTHQLNIQNMPDHVPEGRFQPPKEKFDQDFNLDVSGTGDPIDMATYGQEFTFFYDRMSQNPDVQHHATRRYALNRTFANLLHVGNVEAILGTADEAKQAEQMEMQQAKEQADLAKQAAAAKIAHELKGTTEQNQSASQPPQSQPDQQQQPPQLGPALGPPPPQ